MADAVESFLQNKNSSLEEATEKEVKEAVTFLLEDPQYGSSLRAVLSDKAVFENNEWFSPAFALYVQTDNTKLGGGVFRRTVGGSPASLEKEVLNRKVEDLLQGENYNLLGIGIDLNIEAEEEGYSFVVLGLIGVLMLTLVIFMGILFSSVRLALLTGLGLITLFVWIRGFPFATMGIVKPSLTTEVILPVAFMAFGIDYLVHVIRQYQEGLSKKFEESSIAMTRALDHVGLAIFLAMITSAVAFGANYVSDVEAVEAFAITGVFAALSAYFIMGIVIPILFAMSNKNNRNNVNNKIRVLNVGGFINTVLHHKWITTLLVILCTTALGWSALGVTKNLDPKDFIDSKSNFVVSLDERDAHFSNTRGEEASIYIRGNFNEPGVKEALAEVLNRLQENNYLAHTREGDLVLPYGAPEVKEGWNDLFSERIIFEVVGTRDQEQVKKAYQSLKQDLSILDNLVYYKIIGSPFTRDASLEAVTESLVNTFVVALVIILLILVIVFRSLVYAMITLIPMILVVVWIYGLMGLFGFSLNFITATIAAVSLGVGIDYSVHIVQRFRQEKTKGGSLTGKLKEVGRTTGFAVFVSAISSIVGFLFLALAPMPLFATYGILAAAMIGCSLLATLAVLPLLLSLINKK